EARRLARPLVAKFLPPRLETLRIRVHLVPPMKTRFPRHPRRASSAGVSLVEVMFSTLVVSVSLLTTLGSIATSMQVTRTVSEREVAQRAASAVLQDMTAADFDKVFASYDASTANNPPGVPAPGEFFTVAGLEPPPGVAAAEMGQIFFPTIGTQIREDVKI